MKSYYVLPINKKIAKEMIVDNHYSHKWSSCRYSLGLIFENEIVGVAIYGYPVGRQVVGSISPLLKNDDVLELTRLWLKDEEPKNSESWFLSKTFRWLKENTDIKVLISYSDPMYGHKGIIYQATNWWYQGNDTMLVKSYTHKILGETLHPRTCVAKYGTIKKEELLQIDSRYERIEMLKKHRYLYVLHKEDRKHIKGTLKFSIKKYPKHNKDCSWGNSNVELCINNVSSNKLYYLKDVKQNTLDEWM